MTMIKAVNTIRIEKGRTDEVIHRFENPKAVHTFNGFILMEVMKKEDKEDYDELFIATTWENEAAFEEWRTSRATEKAHTSKKDKQEKPDNPILGAELSVYDLAYRHHPVE